MYRDSGASCVTACKSSGGESCLEELGRPTPRPRPLPRGADDMTGRLGQCSLFAQPFWQVRVGVLQQYWWPISENLAFPASACLDQSLSECGRERQQGATGGGSRQIGHERLEGVVTCKRYEAWHFQVIVDDRCFSRLRQAATKGHIQHLVRACVYAITNCIFTQLLRDGPKYQRTSCHFRRLVLQDTTPTSREDSLLVNSVRAHDSGMSPQTLVLRYV